MPPRWIIHSSLFYMRRLVYMALHYSAECQLVQLLAPFNSIQLTHSNSIVIINCRSFSDNNLHPSQLVWYWLHGTVTCLSKYFQFFPNLSEMIAILSSIISIIRVLSSLQITIIFLSSFFKWHFRLVLINFVLNELPTFLAIILYSTIWNTLSFP